MGDRIEDFRLKVAQRPNDTLARYVLAKEYHDRGRFAESVADFEALVQMKPDWMKCWIHLGQGFVALGRREHARAALTTALELARAQRHEGPEREIEELLASL